MLTRMEANKDPLRDEPEEVLLPIEDVLPGARILDLPEGTSWVGLLILVRTRDESGQPGWSVRRTEGLTDEELLGMVTVQADMLRERALSHGRVENEGLNQ